MATTPAAPALRMLMPAPLLLDLEFDEAVVVHQLDELLELSMLHGVSAGVRAPRACLGSRTVSSPSWGPDSGDSMPQAQTLPKRGPNVGLR